MSEARFEYRAKTWRWTNPPDELVAWLNEQAKEGFRLEAFSGGTLIVSRNRRESEGEWRGSEEK